MSSNASALLVLEETSEEVCFAKQSQQECKRRGNLFACNQLVRKVRDELWYTSQILLVLIECLATLSSLFPRYSR